MTRPDLQVDRAMDITEAANAMAGNPPSATSTPGSAGGQGRVGFLKGPPSAHFRSLGRFPLAVKLVAAMLALVALALLVIGGGSAFALRNILLGRIDGSLTDVIRVLSVP